MEGYDTRFFARVDASPAGNNALNPDNSETGVFDIEFNEDLFLGSGTSGVADPDTTVTIHTGIVDGNDVAGTYNFIVFAVGNLPDSFAPPGEQNKLPKDEFGNPLFLNEVVYIIQIVGVNNGGKPLQLYFLPNADPSADDMAGFADSGSISLDPVNYNPPPGPICVASGSKIMTPQGERIVDEFGVGDCVLTLDRGAQPIIWLTSSKMSWTEAPDTDKPILIGEGAIGVSQPAADLIVSPQHHIVLDGPVVERLFDCTSVLAPAKALVGLPGVRAMKGKRDVEYFHVMLARHEIITVQGVHTESFYPGATAIRMLRPGQRASLYAAVPALKTDPENGYGPTARKKITRREAEKLVAAILADRKAKAIAAE